MSVQEFRKLQHTNGGKKPSSLNSAEFQELSKKCPYKAKIEQILDSLNVKYKKEYLAFKGRKFRFDWAVFLDKCKVEIEYEGIYSEKSGHTTMSGFVSNLEKYNMATVNGWKILRYTAGNIENLANDLTNIINSLK